MERLLDTAKAESGLALLSLVGAPVGADLQAMADYLVYSRQWIEAGIADAESDSATILVGGFNVADDYFQTVEQRAWRDIGLLIEGPAAARLAAYYDKLIEWALRKNSKMRTLRRMIFHHTETKGALQWQLGGPTARLSPWGVSTCKDLVQSRDVPRSPCGCQREHGSGSGAPSSTYS